MKLKKEINKFMEDYAIHLADIVREANLHTNKEIKYHSVYKYLKGINQSMSYEATQAILKAINSMKEALHYEENIC